MKATTARELTLEDLPPNIRRLVAPGQLKEPPKPGELSADGQERALRGARHEEVEQLHKPFIAWLRFHGLLYIHANPAKPSTIQRGSPDFHVMWKGRVCAIEFKWPGQKLRKEQAEYFERLAANETPALVCSDVNEAIAFTKKHLDYHPEEA